MADGRVRARSILFNGGILKAMLLELVAIVNFDRAVMTSILKASDHDVSHIIPSSEIPTVTVQPVSAQISLARPLDIEAFKTQLYWSTLDLPRMGPAVHLLVFILLELDSVMVLNVRRKFIDTTFHGKIRFGKSVSELHLTGR